MNQNSNISNLKEMTWQEVDACDRDKTVIMLPAGPIEQHGPHIPLGTDIYIAEYVMNECAQYLSTNGYKVIIAPAVPYVSALFSLPYPGSVSVRKKIVEEYIFDVLSSFAKGGFSSLILVSQHLDPPWVKTAENCCSRVNEEFGIRAIAGFERIVADVLLGQGKLDLSHVRLKGDTHAGVYEAAPMMHINQELVKKELLSSLPPMEIEFGEMRNFKSFREMGNGLGYTGDVSQVNKELGEKIATYYATSFKELILSHVQGNDVYAHLQCSNLFESF
jgi:creatinine amidohydrolase